VRSEFHDVLGRRRVSSGAAGGTSTGVAGVCAGSPSIVVPYVRLHGIVTPSVDPNGFRTLDQV
jgi:hypothetical protein